MKIFSTLVLFVLTIGFSNAQNEVYLKVNHFLNDEAFAMRTESQNNLGQKFNVTRLEYFVSKINITHDGGQTTTIDHYIRANAGREFNELLGSYDIDHVEGIQFAIGVDPEANHADPSLWPAGHALAPQFPAMHWGWAAGYRFVAIEGFAGSSLAQNYQLHGLGDAYYFQIDLDVDAQSEQGVVTIELNADYARALENINVQSGPIIHGDFGEAVQVIGNFRDYVFTAAGPSSVPVLNTVSAKVFPNPSGGIIQFSYDANETYFHFEVINGLGQRVLQEEGLHGQGQKTIQCDKAGSYMLKLFDDRGAVKVFPFVVQ